MNTKRSNNPSHIVHSIDKGVSTHSRDNRMDTLLIPINCRCTQSVSISLEAQHSRAPEVPLLPRANPHKSPIPQHCNTKDSVPLRMFPYHIITYSVINPQASRKSLYERVMGGYSSFHTLFMERVSK
jgi:hypothetical protein